MTRMLIVVCQHDDFFRINYELLIAGSVFGNLASYLLLVVFVLRLPSLLFRLGHTSGRIPRPLRMSAIAALVVMGALTIAKVALFCYNYWIRGFYRYGHSYVTQPDLIEEAQGLAFAWALLFLVMVLGSMGASIMAANKGKKSGGRVGVSSFP